MSAKFTNPLDSIKVASPCSADWGSMVGNERQRHCGECKLDVYNLSGMTKKEAENLIMNSEGRLCARFYRRKDGTIITQDCPVGWAAVKQRMSKIWTAVASVLITAVGSIGITSFMTQKAEDHRIMGKIQIEKTNSAQNVNEPEVGVIAEINEEPELIMGDIAEPEIDHSKTIMGKIAIPQE